MKRAMSTRPSSVVRLLIITALGLSACSKGAPGGPGLVGAAGIDGAAPDASGGGGATAGSAGGAGAAPAAAQDGGAMDVGAQASNDASGGAGMTGTAGHDAGPGHDGGGGATGAQTATWDDSLRQRVVGGIAPLQTWYDATTGLWDTNDWWTSANQLETVIDDARETGDTTYFDDIDTTFVKNQSSNFDRFGYYDDDGWFAVAWIKAYDLTHQQKYLDMAKTIFTRMTGGWDDKCGGGIYWASAEAGSNGRVNKNAIPNSLFLQAAARLHQRTPGDAGAGSYLDWAEREWAWFKGTGMLTSKNLVVDGLDGLTTCKAAGPTFTYNQGVLMGGLVDLAAATGDATLLDQAESIAHATMTMMSTTGGILKEAPCGGDICVQFKGVFMRNLALLYRTRPAADLQTYMRHQSDQLWNVNRNAQSQFGYEWDLPFDKATASRQSSALDALVAAVASSEPNVALGELGSSATASASCSAAEGPSNAIDGSSRWDSKWCAPGAGDQTLTVDLGVARLMVGFRVRHAGAGGENSAWNTRDFEIATSGDGQTWTDAVTVTGNTADVTTHPIASTTARYARLHVTTAQTAPDTVATRIYELEIFGVGL
jgi:predicted alpha-1,6-mannanase (GH76 family)